MQVTKTPPLKYYPLLLMIIVTVQVLCFILVKLHITIFGISTTTSGLLFPIDIYLFEIIGYCYGYEYSRQAVWLNSSSHCLFFVVLQLCNYLPYSSTMQSEYINAYHIIFRNSYWIIIGSFIGNFIGDYFSAYIVPKFKLIFNGNFTRSLIFVTHIIAEFLTISISYTIMNLSSRMSLIEVFNLVLGTMLFKTILAFLLLPFAKMLINFIKSSEGVEAYDFNQNYKLFKFSPDLNKVKFIDCIGIYKHEKNMHN